MTAMVHRIPLDDLLALLNRPVLFQVRWKVSEEDGSRFLADCIRDARHRLGISGRGATARAFWNGSREKIDVWDERRNWVCGFSGTANPVAELLAWGYTAPTFFAVTLGEAPVVHARWLKDAGEFQKYFLWHGFCAELADAAAEWVETHLNSRIRSWSISRRYSPGYPAWPDISTQEALLAAVDGETLGITLTSDCQLVPEYSVTGLVLIECREDDPNKEDEKWQEDGE